MRQKPHRSWATGAAFLLFAGSCSDWASLYGEDCHGDWIEEGSTCPHFAQCGNKQLESGEECDDGNVKNGDGCSSGCQLEAEMGGSSGQQIGDGGEAGAGGATSHGPACGNGQMDEGELCDDGNTNNTDSCLSACLWASCGDGVVRKGVEECDDGNLLNGDECARSCLERTVGDHLIGGSDHTYTYHEVPVTFDEAYESCAELGGYLWTAASAGETRQVMRPIIPSDVEVWIGLQQNGDSYAWITGEASTYRAWIEGEPTANPCVVQYETTGDLENFATRPCDELRGFVCERQAPLIDPESHHAYRRWMMKITQEEATAFCQSEGGTLVSTETEEERAALAATFTTPFWVEARQTGTGEYVWNASGSVIRPEELAEPENPQEENACLTQIGTELLPTPCDAQTIFVCEFD